MMTTDKVMRVLMMAMTVMMLLGMTRETRPEARL